MPEGKCRGFGGPRRNWMRRSPGTGFPIAVAQLNHTQRKAPTVEPDPSPTLATERISKRIAIASDEELNRVVEGLNESLGSDVKVMRSSLCACLTSAVRRFSRIIDLCREFYAARSERISRA